MIFIGLGGTGIKVASILAKTTESTLITIDNKNSDIIIPICKSMEEYEEITLTDYEQLEIHNEEIYFCLAGSGLITGSCLKLLKQIRYNNVNIIFITPDQEQASKEQRLRNKVCKRILQEMVRGGMLSKIYLFDNRKIANVSNVNIMNYYDVINKVICDSFLTVQYLYDSDPIRDNLTTPIEACSIVVLGISEFEKTENLFHTLENPRFIHIIYELCNETLTKKQTLDKIIEQTNTNELNSYKVVLSDTDRVFYVYYTNFAQD